MPSGTRSGRSRSPITLSSIRSPAALQKCGTRIFTSSGAICSMSRAPPIRRTAPSSSACRMSAGSMKRSAAGGGMRMMTWASRSGSLDLIGSTVTTASTTDLLAVRMVSTVVLVRSSPAASITPLRAAAGSPGPAMSSPKSASSSAPGLSARMSPALRSCWRILPLRSMARVSVCAEGLDSMADISAAIADVTSLVSLARPHGTNQYETSRHEMSGKGRSASLVGIALRTRGRADRGRCGQSARRPWAARRGRRWPGRGPSKPSATSGPGVFRG